MRTALIIPTYNESESLEKFSSKIKQVQDQCQNGNGDTLSILVVDDDSPDGTANTARKLGFDVLVRHGEKGLASAVIDGIDSFDGTVDSFIVMDADGQHDINLIPEIIKNLEHNDVVIPSRYIREGKIEGWSRFRRLTSTIANWLALPLLPKIKDRTTGYFGFKKKILAGVKLDRDIGYKICLEILAKAKYETFVELPYTFSIRTAGESKFNTKQTLLYLKHLLRLYLNSRLFKFLTVGASGAVVKLGLTYLLVSVFGLHYLLGYPIAFIMSVVNNYVLNSVWTFQDRESNLFGLGKYALTSSLTLSINELLMYVLTDVVGFWYIFSTMIAIMSACLLNFILSKTIVWVKPKCVRNPL